MWSLGVLMYWLMFGQRVVRDPNVLKTDRRFRVEVPRSRLRGPPVATYSPDCVRFLMELLENEPDRRMGAARAKSHPWLSGVRKPGESEEEAHVRTTVSVVERDIGEEPSGQ